MLLNLAIIIEKISRNFKSCSQSDVEASKAAGNNPLPVKTDRISIQRKQPIFVFQRGNNPFFKFGLL